ncbi:hypothetical protein B0H13DRAFT_2352680 [Mycena leptocephala]|nr:hypothetical protein B0H13DRAFT_2352680 [Mycena leptocephala]
MPHATFTSSSFSCGRLFYRSSVAPLDLYVEVTLMHIAQLCAAFPLTLRRYDRLPSSTPPCAVAHHQERGPAGERLPPLEAQGGFFLRSSLPLPLFPLSSLPPAFLPQVRVCVNANDAFVAQVAGPEERPRIVDAICVRDGEMMMHRNWAVQRCFGAATGPEERRKIVAYMRCVQPYCRPRDELPRVPRPLEATRLRGGGVCSLIVSELLRGDLATTLVNKHASHVWNHGALADPTNAVDLHVAVLACHETGSLVARHAFENLEGQGAALFGKVTESQWGSYWIQHIIPEHGSETHRQMALEHLLTGLLEFATNDACASLRRVRLLSLDLHNLILGFLRRLTRTSALCFMTASAVTLRGCKTGSKVIWLLYVHPIQFLFYLFRRILFSGDRMRACYGY